MCTGLDQLFSKPEVAVLIAQGYVCSLDGHHALCLKALSNADLNLHGIGSTFTILAIKHGFLFIVENHLFPSCFLFGRPFLDQRHTRVPDNLIE